MSFLMESHRHGTIIAGENTYMGAQLNLYKSARAIGGFFHHS